MKETFNTWLASNRAASKPMRICEKTRGQRPDCRRGVSPRVFSQIR